MLTIKKLGDGAFHFQTNGKSHGLLSRYDILSDDVKLSKSYADCSAEITESGAVLRGALRDVALNITSNEKGYLIEIPATQKERFFGIGDATRDKTMLRGRSVGIWVSNVCSYGPIPFLLSSDGWAILINSTYKQRFDICDTDKNTVKIFVIDDVPDFYLFTAKTMKETLSCATDVMGKPLLLPSFAYGLTFVENELMTSAKELIEDVVKMREKKIPCDVIGLEPSWMETYYDMTADKKWDKKRFPFPVWREDNYYGHFSFVSPVKRLGMELSLWLCEDYDLIYEEERQAEARLGAGKNEDIVSDLYQREFEKNLEFLDFHLTQKRRDIACTKIDEPWYEHLKKFVDNGASVFKLDGSRQVLEHPQRAWAEKYFDKEVHNIYPTVLVKQMHNGYLSHTGRRSMTYSGGGYVGVQKFAATWAGDTGGGPRTLVSCLNYAMCGHTNTSCDMDVLDIKAIHYGFLQSWSQINSWASYELPWYLTGENEDSVRYYSTLRSSLFPYIYTNAHNAAVTGVPILRPLSLQYEDTDRFDDVLNAYMLGDSLYVGAFDMNLTLPDGEWVDYFTGKKYSGNVNYEIPEGKGGALMAKSGSIIATMTPQLYINEREHDYVMRVFPGADAEFKLYEDDGYTYDFLEGGYTETLFTLKDNGKKGCSVTVNLREGSYAGRPDNGFDNYLNSPNPKIKGSGAVRDMKIAFHAESVKSAKINGIPCEFELVNGAYEVTLPASIHEKEIAVVSVEY